MWHVGTRTFGLGDIVSIELDYNPDKILKVFICDVCNTRRGWLAYRLLIKKTTKLDDTIDVCLFCAERLIGEYEEPCTTAA